jgi:hypothetical protein
MDFGRYVLIARGLMQQFHNQFEQPLPHGLAHRSVGDAVRDARLIGGEPAAELIDSGVQIPQGTVGGR